MTLVYKVERAAGVELDLELVFDFLFASALEFGETPAHALEMAMRVWRPSRMKSTGWAACLIELANTLVQKDREWTPKKLDQDGHFKPLMPSCERLPKDQGSACP